jgi:hypothetical protein
VLPAPATPPPPTREQHAHEDLFAVIIGPPKYGKTSLASMLLRDHLERGFWVFAHDPSGQFFDTCASYPTFAAWEKAAAKAAAGGAPMPRGAAIAGDVRDVIDGVKKLGERFNTQWRHRMPLLLVCDEGSLLESSSSHTDKADRELFSRRRHFGLSIVLLLQYSTMLNRQVLALTTDVYLFAQSEDDIERLEKLLFQPGGTLCALPSLPKHRYVHCRRGEGLVR